MDVHVESIDMVCVMMVLVAGYQPNGRVNFNLFIMRFVFCVINYTLIRKLQLVPD